MNLSAESDRHCNIFGKMNTQPRRKWYSKLFCRRQQPNLEDLCAVAKNGRKMARCRSVVEMKQKMLNQRTLRNDLCPISDTTYRSHHGFNPTLREYFRPDIQSNNSAVQNVWRKIKRFLTPSL